MKNSICILSVWMLLSCSRKDTATAVQDAREILKDSIVLNDINSDAELSYAQNRFGHLTISFYGPKRDKVHTYNTHDKKISTIEIDPGKAGREFYLSDDTTLYILNGGENYLTIFKNGRYSYVHTTQKDSLPATLYSMVMPFQVINKHVLLHKTLYHDARTKAGRKSFFSSDMLYLFEIKQDSLIEVANFGAFPEEYISNLHYEFFPKSAYDGTLQEAYYLFNNNNTIYQYNLRSNKLQFHTIRGLQKNNQKPFEENKFAELSYAQSYQLENSQYFMLLHDHIQNRIAVVQKIGIPSTNAKGELNLFSHQPYQVYSINDKYEVENIFRFENNKNHKFPFAYCHGGLLYVPARDVKVNNRKNELTIYVYKIS